MKTTCWVFLNDKYSEHYDFLDNDITESEVEIAIKQLNTKKSPGKDGLPSEFYQQYSKELIGILTQVFNEGISRGFMGDTFYEGVLSLLYKKGDNSDINNYRHLTMMNLDYKIYAKVLMNRLSDVLDLIIIKEQTCAVKGRLIWDNLCSLRQIIYESGQIFYIVAFDKKKRPLIIFQGHICFKF
uniref:Reverse transcriptase domain-containing protein n=1 Tax=Astyanax mexicanus TaxID=7994 RepID=A0A3B1JIM2_ASTMX